jgi:two-component system sensor histidine kinase HydH
MATLAALALTVTTLMARRALDNAAGVVIRGDGDILVAAVVIELWRSGPSLTPEVLARVVEKHGSRGLRYVALLDRQDHHVISEAGSQAIASGVRLPGEIVRKGGRVRLLALIPPRSETGAATDASSPPGPVVLAPFPRPYLVVEFEPPLIRRLREDLVRISIVAAAAALILVAFAIAWSRSAARLAAVELHAERERRLVALGRASSVIAHELRNPLAGLKGHAQLLVEDLEGPSRERAERVVESAERLQRLTTVLLEFVRDAPVAPRDITPKELVERTLVALPKDRVRVDLSDAPVTLCVDAERVSLALRNLVQNALHETDADALPVELRVAARGGDVAIEVRDHGPGLAPGAGEHIFEPFMTTKARGTGLGLAIARRIAEQHRGTLTGETHRSGGALFRFLVPQVSTPERLR